MEEQIQIICNLSHKLLKIKLLQNRKMDKITVKICRETK